MSRRKVQRGSPRINENTWKVFLEKLRINGNATQASALVGIDRTTAYNKRNEDADFAKAWDDAVNDGRQRLADQCIEEAFRRGHDGWDEPVVSQGQVVVDPENGGYLRIRKYSDGLLSKLMDGLAPKTFKPTPQDRSNDMPAELQPDPVPTPDEPGPEKPIL